MGECPALSRTKQRYLGRGEDQEDKGQHCHYRRFASWSRIPNRSWRYGGQGPARSREVLSRKSGHRRKGRPTFHRECGIQDKNQDNHLFIRSEATEQAVHYQGGQGLPWASGLQPVTRTSITAHLGVGMAPTPRSQTAFSCLCLAVSHLASIIWLLLLFPVSISLNLRKPPSDMNYPDQCQLELMAFPILSPILPHL